MANTEKGKSLWGVIRTIGGLAVVLFVLGIVIKYFMGTLFGDSVIELTIKEVSARAISISSQLISGQKNISNIGNPTTEHGYPVSVYTVEGSFFEITLFNVPKSVCRGIASRGWNVPTSIYINGRLIARQPFICGVSNQISFEFSRDLNNTISNAVKPKQNHCHADSDCSGCEACQNGRCVSGCRSGEKCSYTLKGRSVCCADGNKADSLCCSFMEDGQCCWGRGQCCPPEKPIRLTDGTCTDCYDKRVFGIGEPTDINLCRTICPNRIDFGEDDLCMLPLCQSGEFTDRSGDCITCSAGGGYRTSPQECAKCPNRVYQKGWCLAPCPAGTIRNTDNQCVPCDDTDVIKVSDTDSCHTLCPNRDISPFGCVLTDCPAGFAPDAQGRCFDCNTSVSVSDISAESCARCANRVYEKGKCVLPCPADTFRDKDGACVSCMTPKAVAVVPNDLECHRCPDRLALNGYCFASCKAGQFRDAFGTCHPCTDLESFPVLRTATCSVCPNRSIFLRQQNNQIISYCMLQYCPLDFFTDKFGGCHDCFDKNPVSDTQREECDKCSNRQWSVTGETCYIKQDCEDDEIIDNEGQCHSCLSDDEAIFIGNHPKACLSCSNRYLYGSWCRKCPQSLATLTDRDGCEKCGGIWDNRISLCAVKPSS